MVSGSPKFDLYNADFGWGRARKMEVVYIDGGKHSMFLCKSRDFEGGLEVGLSLPKATMEAFAAIFEVMLLQTFKVFIRKYTIDCVGAGKGVVAILQWNEERGKRPEIRYVARGSAVSLTIAESSGDFHDLIGNHAREADQFHEFVPQIDPVTDESEYQRVPLMALKVTLFPGRGICIGFANLHCLGDASSLVGFIQAWASISKVGGDEEFLTRQGLLQVSSFVVMVSYVWTCFVKSRKQVDDDVLEFFVFSVDIRARVDQPVPAKYFEAIADQIFNRVNKKDEVLKKGAENWILEAKKLTTIEAHAVSGSPNFDLYNADFGWGGARKMEVVSIDGEKHSMFLCKSRFRGRIGG
ncbi:UNVERIFIED_CONTAM: Malonyl-coenzyme:anthocyanin 5-O-glucoside-6'''-O-malonyltransferase [Sesamum radiatum]|uniref:Malonyl-coenzyme:anthocyanin 5-O-glucoside-6'''-O-malonyltransferase n=1 Tax=Sesamum radiatum TaxID=300843 RepID=A0AAW2T570_SESRA